MKIYGIIAEYNPFHNGHKYHIDMCRENGADVVVTVMSGDFTQRGSPAIMPRSQRVQCALAGGADITITLPVIYATGSAPRFAHGGVSILSSLGCLDKISFGSECGDYEKLEQCALALQNPEFDALVAQKLKCGITYASAAHSAVQAISGKSVAAVLDNPNDLLGVEYIAASKSLGFDSEFFCVKRNGYSHDSQLSGEYSSSSSIRERIELKEDFSCSVPPSTKKIIDSVYSTGGMPPNTGLFEASLMYALRRMTVDDLAVLPDVSEGLENRLFDAIHNSANLEQLFSLAKTKRFTHARLRRILLYAYIGITRELQALEPQYIHVTGFTENGRAALSKIKRTASLPVVTRASDIKKLGDEAKQMFNLEALAADLYSLLLPVPDKCGALMTDKIITPTERL